MLRLTVRVRVRMRSGTEERQRAEAHAQREGGTCSGFGFGFGFGFGLGLWLGWVRRVSVWGSEGVGREGGTGVIAATRPQPVTQRAKHHVAAHLVIGVG